MQKPFQFNQTNSLKSGFYVVAKKTVYFYHEQTLEIPRVFQVQELLKSESENLTEEEMKLTIDDYVDCVERVFLKMYEGTDKGPR